MFLSEYASLSQNLDRHGLTRRGHAAQALVRLPKSYSQNDCKEMTVGCCELLQLEHVMNTVVGSVEKRGLSGGQRKRVNIGLELVRKGLSPFSCSADMTPRSRSSQAVQSRIDCRGVSRRRRSDTLCLYCA